LELNCLNDPILAVQFTINKIQKMKYLFTLLATCFVLGLSAQTASDGVMTVTNKNIEAVKQDLQSQDATLVLSPEQVEELQSALKSNSEIIVKLNSSGMDQLEVSERLSKLEAERDDIVLKALTAEQQVAFKTAKKMRR